MFAVQSIGSDTVHAVEAIVSDTVYAVEAVGSLVVCSDCIKYNAASVCVVCTWMKIRYIWSLCVFQQNRDPPERAYPVT